MPRCMGMYASKWDLQPRQFLEAADYQVKKKHTKHIAGLPIQTGINCWQMKHTADEYEAEHNYRTTEPGIITR